MDKEEKFFASLLEVFKVEADEHIKALADGLLKLENAVDGDRQALLETVYREAHSLKGAARSVNLFTIQDICQAMENVLGNMKKTGSIPSQTVYDTLLSTIDEIKEGIRNSIDSNKAQKLIDSLNAITFEPQKDIPIPKQSDKRVHQPLVSSEKDKTIRIAVDKIDTLFHEVEELIMVKMLNQQQIANLKDIFEQAEALEKEQNNLFARDASMQKGEASLLDKQSKRIKTLKNSITNLIKNSKQAAHTVNSIVDAMTDDVKSILMQPISTLFEIVPHMARDLGNELGKKIHIEMEGGDIEVDRRVLEQLKAPLLHIIRNAIDHGIEKEAKRIEMHKDPSGKILLQAREVGSGSIEILISDDGKGMDQGKLKEIAIKQKYISEEESGRLSEEEIFQLAFQSGISTSTSITELSGRGLGLGIVVEKVEALGGKVKVESQPGKGTTFKLILPLTLATFRGITVTAGSQNFIVPIHNVVRVMRLKQNELNSLEASATFTFEKRTLPYISLSKLLNLEESSEAWTHLLILKSEDKMIALGTDRIKNEQEVIVISLGKQFAKMNNFMAASITENGEVVPILNPFDVIQSAYRSEEFANKLVKHAEERKAAKKILITEDSLTTRLLLQNILESSGYETIIATDGAEGYDILLKDGQSIDLLLTDLEMPRMDGWMLIEKVRALPLLKDLPIIICSSKDEEKDRALGMELGANAYLDKGSFNQQNLLNAIARLI